MWRRWLENILFHALYMVVRGLAYTYRFDVRGEEHRAAVAALHPKGSYLLACWHEHVWPVSVAQAGHPFSPLVSRNTGGRMIAYMLRRLGFTPVAGSQKRGGRDKGGAAARHVLLDVLERGGMSALTVDGSVGPRRWAKPGIIDLARKSGAGIIAIGVWSDRFWQLKTWDRMKIPKPFARVAVVYSAPIVVPADTAGDDFIHFQERVGNALNGNERVAREHLGTFKARTPPREPQSRGGGERSPG